eukprot:2711231-Amphidinium_carterae.1
MIRYDQKRSPKHGVKPCYAMVVVLRYTEEKSSCEPAQCALLGKTCIGGGNGELQVHVACLWLCHMNQDQTVLKTSLELADISC